MTKFNHLLLDVWRDACRHVEIGESLAIGAPVLFRRLPLDVLLVRRIDYEHSAIETLASGSPHSSAAGVHHRTTLTSAEFEEVLSWCRTGEVLYREGEARDGFAALLAGDLAGDVIAGPLNHSDGPLGILVGTVRRSRQFQQRHRDMFQLLLEPFASWLDNDRRIRDLRLQREAAEADRQSLLARLGRTDLNDAVVGAESGLRHVMERVGLVAHTDVPVLILGETGSGKEVVARAIHNHSSRASGPFLRVNCGAIAPDLVDSELFGHERGSFTGAVGLRKGWFERADGGTLFLDECGELPSQVQVRLLRILQDGTFERVGGEQQMHVDVRIVAATHRDLESMVKEGSFRQDLWYRMAVFAIHLPALRDRRQDIPEMAAHFAMKSARKLGLAPSLPDADDLSRLVAYDWPGNVRELAAVIERAAILGEGRRLEVAKALGVAGPARQYLDPEASTKPIPTPSSDATFPTLDEAMVRHIRAALERTGGRIEGLGGTAQLLDINPHTLRARMRKLGVDPGEFRG